MKRISETVISSKPISISKANKVLSTFISSENNGAPQAVTAYLRRTSESFNELAALHRDLRCARPDHKRNEHRSETIPNPRREKRLLEDHQGYGRAHQSVGEKKKRREREVNISGDALYAGIDMIETNDAVDREGFGAKEYKKLKKKKKQETEEGDVVGDVEVKRKEASRKRKNAEVEMGKKDRKKRKTSGVFQHE